MMEPIEPDERAGESTEGEVTAARRPRLSVRLLGLLLVIGSVVLATYLVVAYFAFESGRALQVEQETTARTEQINRQVELAREDLTEGSPHLALTRLDWVLTQDPGNPAAQAMRAEAEAAQGATRTPRPTEPPEATPEGTLEAAAEGEPRAELQAIRRLVAAEQWEEALPLLLALQQRFPDYERGETDQLLYDTYLGLGLTYVNSDKVEIGLNYLTQAERLGDLPQEAQDYRLWADLYFQAVAYSGVNWEIASDYWSDLCAVAPFYQDSCARFQRALIGWGDQFAYYLDWCPAQRIYQQAWNREPTETLGAKLGEARAGCAAATPIPITGTETLTGTAPLTPTEPGG
ncbi:hypothetical protein [Promineifilum sp.]|uniref:hypothetical protein n=1 Tax=Promineifilum sp. TaxID=2664178 RepID=UPI0035AFC677